MKFDCKKIIELSKQDYENTWKMSKKLIEFKGKKFKLQNFGESHPILDFVSNFRKIMINLGFKEVILPILINENDVKKQYGPESLVILDRIFYLAGLERSDIGINKEKINEINKIIPNLDSEKIKELQNIFREYKKGKIEADDIIEAITNRMNIKEEQSSLIINSIFSELGTKIIPSSLTLRSHTTAAWFPLLSTMCKTTSTPIQLFSIGEKFRREQKLDNTHLYSSLTGSLVIMSNDITLEDMKILTKQILDKFGFKKTEVVTKKVTSKYYIPETEFEIFIKHPNNEKMIEIGNGGFYNPISLSQYKIPYHVFNIGFGIERIVMILNNENDIRKLVYPETYKNLEMSDKEISESISMISEPKTEYGKKIANIIENGIKKYKNEIGPSKFLVYENKIKIFISEPEQGKKLLGPAGENEIFIDNGNIIGVRQDKIQNGIMVISYLKAISNLFASQIESGKNGRLTIKMADTLPSINLKLNKKAENYINSKNKKINIGGPIFIDIEIQNNNKI